jgi:hypothetical protein
MAHITFTSYGSLAEIKFVLGWIAAFRTFPKIKDVLMSSNKVERARLDAIDGVHFVAL